MFQARGIHAKVFEYTLPTFMRLNRLCPMALASIVWNRHTHVLLVQYIIGLGEEIFLGGSA